MIDRKSIYTKMVNEGDRKVMKYESEIDRDNER